MHKRGQVDAPIELFVAVIILAMSMALAFYVINSSSESQCLAEMNSEVRSLQTALVDVAIGSPPTSRIADFYMRTCGTRKVEGLRFVKYTAPDICRACSSYTGSCWKIEPVYVDSVDGRIKAISEASMCVQMPIDLSIEDEAVGTAAGGLQRNPSCTPLSESPCPEELGGRCKLPSAIAAIESDQYWKTLGASGGENYFRIKLTKGVHLGALGDAAGQKGYIAVCAMTKKDAQEAGIG